MTSNQYRLQPGARVQIVAAAGEAGHRRPAGAMNISAPFIQRPIATSLLMAAILLVGLVAYPLLPVAPLPQVDFPDHHGDASLPGASSGDHGVVGRDAAGTPVLADPRRLPDDLDQRSGQHADHVQFDLDRNIDAAAQDVQAAINAAGGQLPKNLPTPPTYRKINPADSPILIFAVHSDALPLTDGGRLRRERSSRSRFAAPGRRAGSIGGQQKPAVRVQIDPGEDRGAGHAARGRRAASSRRRRSMRPRARSTAPPATSTIYDNDQMLKAAPWNDVIVAYRNGAPVRIRDIGVAIDGPENNQLAAWQNGKHGILLLVYKQPGANVIDTVRRIKALLPQVLTAMPPSIKVDKVIDRTTTIKASVEDVEFTLVLTIVLVVMVIFLFLRNFWATVIPGITVPLALLGTVGADVCARLHPRQSVADGADHRRRLRRRRRHRHAGEHLSPYRGGLPPMEAALKGARRNRLHDRLDQHFAGRGVHPAAADGRHRRAPVPRIRHDRDHDDRWFRPSSR